MNVAGSPVIKSIRRSVMHEFGLCEGVLDSVRQRAAGRPVAGVRLRVGVRHAVDEASMTQAFRLCAEGTEASDASLDLVFVPALVSCRECGAQAETVDALAICPTCHSADVLVSGGDELVLESLTYAPVPAGPAVK
jgi:hydrogenase nickel incorporation protein HypA/HybF